MCGNNDNVNLYSRQVNGSYLFDELWYKPAPDKASSFGRPDEPCGIFKPPALPADVPFGNFSIIIIHIKY